jgi:hypothetical protein
MTHREFLLWLSPRLEGARSAGLDRDGLRAIRDELVRMQNTGALQPFASRLLAVVEESSALDPALVAELAREARRELAPPREKTVVLSGSDQDDE